VDERNLELAKLVGDGDSEIYEMAVNMDEDCLKVLALHQPVAIDLRVIIAVLKITSDLERIGDLAMDIAKRAQYFATHKEVEFAFDFRNMAQEAQTMLQQCLDAFINLDIKMATQVCEADDRIDDMHKEMFEKVQQAIQAHPENIGSYLSSMTISRCLERVADHTTNISEDVIYMAEGHVVRHSGEIY
jgi:phosphate transport system protein